MTSERYVFVFPQAVKLGRECDLKMIARPSIGLRVTTVMSNDENNLSTVQSWRMGGVDLIDQFAVRPVYGAMFCVPALTASALIRKGEECVLRGRYGGFVPKGRRADERHTIVFTVTGEPT